LPVTEYVTTTPELSTPSPEAASMFVVLNIALLLTVTKSFWAKKSEPLIFDAPVTA